MFYAKWQRNVFLCLGVFDTCATAIFVYSFIVGLPLLSLPIILSGAYLILSKLMLFVGHCVSLIRCNSRLKKISRGRVYLETYNPNKNKDKLIDTSKIINFDDNGKDLNNNSNDDKSSKKVL